MLTNDRYHIINNFKMNPLPRERSIRVYLPKGYYQFERTYPVIYMHDGQNLFDPSISYGGDTWQIPQAVDRLFDLDEGVIVVGIDNGAEFNGLCRMYEYSPWKMDQSFNLPDWDPSVYQSGGEGGQYIDFIANTLKPYIDEMYLTKPERESTAIAGSSMGGLISLYGVMERPDIFSMAGVFSPAFWFNQPEMVAYLDQRQLDESVRIYMDMGTKESSGGSIDFENIYLDGSNKVNHLLEKNDRINLHYVVEEGAEHTESAWARRFPDMLNFFYK